MSKVHLQEYVYKWMVQNIKSDKEIFFGEVHGGHCRKLWAGVETQITDLSSNQEEADNRIMLYINDGVVKHGLQSVLVVSSDTDVFINLMSHFATVMKTSVEIQVSKCTLTTHIIYNFGSA